MAAGGVRKVLSWVAILCGVAFCLWSLFLFAKQANSQLEPGEVECEQTIEPPLGIRVLTGSASCGAPAGREGSMPQAEIFGPAGGAPARTGASPPSRPPSS